MTTAIRTIGLTACLLLLAACNEPPLYATHAAQYLAEQGIDKRLIRSVTERRPLTAEQAEQLGRFDNASVLHLLGENPGTPAAMLSRLAADPRSEVRTGAAANPHTPLATLSKLRAPGRKTADNQALARNPALSQTVLREMYGNGEAELLSFALNANCPAEIMEKIVDSGSPIERAWLARNPNLPPSLRERLQRDPDPTVQRYLRTAPGAQPAAGSGH